MLIKISSILCILPSLTSLFVYNKLPNKLPIHFDINGVADSYGNKLFVCIILPLIFCALNIILNIFINNDPYKKNHNKNLRTLIYFIIPTISLITTNLSILIGLGFNVNVPIILNMFMSILFILMGLYLPKCKRNYTIGIKLPWTLNDEDNWIKTHKLSGYLWLICGFCNILITLIYKKESLPILLNSIIISTIVPCIYSFILYKKNKNT